MHHHLHFLCMPLPQHSERVCPVTVLLLKFAFLYTACTYLQAVLLPAHLWHTPSVLQHYHEAVAKSCFSTKCKACILYACTIACWLAQGIFNTLVRAGQLVEQTIEQLYSETAGKFLADRFVTGTCPKCQYEVSSLVAWQVCMQSKAMNAMQH